MGERKSRGGKAGEGKLGAVFFLKSPGPRTSLTYVHAHVLTFDILLETS